MTTKRLAGVITITGGLCFLAGVILATGFIGGLITLGVLLMLAGASEL